MATQTTHYSLVKPAYEDQADVGVLNGDLDQIDQLIYDNGRKSNAAATFTADADGYINTSNRNVNFYRIGKMAILTFSVNLLGNETPTSNAYYVVGAIPENFRPAGTFYACAPIRDTNESAAISINASNQLALRHRNTTAGYLQFTMAYPLHESVI